MRLIAASLRSIAFGASREAPRVLRFSPIPATVLTRLSEWAGRVSAAISDILKLGLADEARTTAALVTRAVAILPDATGDAHPTCLH